MGGFCAHLEGSQLPLTRLRLVPSTLCISLPPVRLSPLPDTHAPSTLNTLIIVMTKQAVASKTGKKSTLVKTRPPVYAGKMPKSGKGKPLKTASKQPRKTSGKTRTKQHARDDEEDNEEDGGREEDEGIWLSEPEVDVRTTPDTMIATLSVVLI